MPILKNDLQCFVIKLFIALILSVNLSYAEDICVFLKYCRGNGSGSSRGSAQSVPSNSTAASLNPGNISQVKGIGLETLYQPSNPIQFSLVTGDGKIGALVSPNLENSFFGNRSIEIDDLTYARNIDHKQYKNNKINFALGAMLADKRDFGMDLGVSFKRNPDIKKINLGVGVTARWYYLNFGAFIYNDDVKINLGNYINPYNGIPYSALYGSSTYQEKFSVSTFTVGTRISDLTFDVGRIKTQYKFYTNETLIYLYSTSYNYKKYLFNLSLRKEYSDNYQYKMATMVYAPLKEELYLGAQYLVNQHFVWGIQYNNFLLHELSATITLFY